MKLIELGNCCHRNVHCWLAIIQEIEQWALKADRAVLEANFEDGTLLLVLKEPGQIPRKAMVDISWIAHPEHADRLAVLTRMALVDIELARCA